MTVGSTAQALAAAILSGSTTAEEVIGAALSRLAREQTLNAVVHELSRDALAEACAIDRRLQAGESVGPLAGVPVVVKDNICTEKLPTTCGSRLLSGYVSPFEATAVQRLRAAGAVIVAKSNCDEFAMGSSNENSSYGPVRNPHDPTRVSGGSSGGSAAVVAAGHVPLALGSDTGGSVRQPAALCGVVGLKPTYGRVSRWGLVAFGSSFDQIGTLSASVEDAAVALQAIAGPDDRDDRCDPQPVPSYQSALHDDVRGRHVGVWRGALTPGDIDARVAAAVESAAQQLAQAGAELHEIELPYADEALSIYYVLAAAEASSNLARFDGIRYGQRSHATTLAATYANSRGEGLGPEVKRRILLGTFVSSAGYHDRYYDRAQAARTAFNAELDRLMTRDDLLLMPTAPSPAFRFGEKLQDPLQMYRCDLFTVPASLSGHPAISLPAPRTEGQLPVGVQLMARHYDEATLLNAAAALERRGFRSEPAA